MHARLGIPGSLFYAWWNREMDNKAKPSVFRLEGGHTHPWVMCYLRRGHYRRFKKWREAVDFALTLTKIEGTYGK